MRKCSPSRSLPPMKNWIVQVSPSPNQCLILCLNCLMCYLILIIRFFTRMLWYILLIIKLHYPTIVEKLFIHSFNFVYPRYPFRYLKKYLISQGAVLKSKYTEFKDVRLIINGYWLTIINGYWLTDKNLFLSIFLNFSRFSIA